MRIKNFKLKHLPLIYFRITVCTHKFILNGFQIDFVVYLLSNSILKGRLFRHLEAFVRTDIHVPAQDQIVSSADG